MSKDPKTERISNFLSLFVIALTIIGIVYTALNYRSGPIESIGGTVLSTRGIQRESGPSIQLVTIRLASGQVVTATTVPGVIAFDGDVAFLRSYKHAISGAPSFEVYRVERGK